ncbi:MAG: site-specific DNA-methyltransferase, partial [Ignavibacteria bacterium]|nr:site-specific DNA-methyltransferase [Ignavibacteria bacterium]
LARNLLSDDGVIFVSIDDHEVHHLRMIMNEIFGEENFVANIIAITNRSGRDYGGIARTHEYILVYKKTELALINEIPKENEYEFPYKDTISGFEIRELRNRNIRFNIDNRPNLFYAFYVNPNKKDENGFYSISLKKDENYCIEVFPKISQGVQTVWRWGKEKASAELNINIVGKKLSNGEFQIVEKYRKSTKMLRSLIDDKEIVNERGTEKLKQIFNGQLPYDYPKSTSLLNILLKVGSEKESIILDFFAGSGTTGHAVWEINKEDGGNRKFILVQLDEEVQDDEIKKDFPTVADICIERLRRVSEKMKAENESNLINENANMDLGFKVFKLDKSNFNLKDEFEFDPSEDKEKLK